MKSNLWKVFAVLFCAVTLAFLVVWYFTSYINVQLSTKALTSKEADELRTELDSVKKSLTSLPSEVEGSITSKYGDVFDGSETETGDTVNDENAGEPGPAGAQGSTGPRGQTGASGSNGVAGPVGTQGENGTNGANGTNGTDGVDGIASCPNGSCVSLQGVTPGVVESGNINVSGAILAGSFSGDGSALTGLDASTIILGTLSDTRLSANVSLLGSSIQNAEVDDNLTISSSGTVAWTALSDYPVGCAVGEAVTAIGDTLTCTALGGSGVSSLNALTGDLSVVGNSQLAVSPSGSTINLSVVGDSVGDSQLAFDTGQHLTITSSPTFNGLTLTSLTVGGGTTITGHLSLTQASVVSAQIAATACGNYASISVPGAALGDSVVATPTAIAGGIEAVNLGWSATVTAASTVTIRACNPALGAINTGDTQTWRVDIWKH